MNAKSQHRGRSLFAASIVALFVLAGCVPVGEPRQIASGVESITVAKNDIFDVQRELIAHIPEEGIVSQTPIGGYESHLVVCDRERERYSWPDTVYVTVVEGTDVAAIINSVESAWRVKPEWDVSWSRSESGRQMLDLRRADGLDVSLSSQQDGSRLMIIGFTACFPLADYSPFEKY